MTSGILSCKLWDAAIIPFAIVAQFTIPPNTFTRITFTFGSRDIKQNIQNYFIFKKIIFNTIINELIYILSIIISI